MSNPLKKTILKEIVEPAIKSSKTTMIAKVVAFHKRLNTIDIKVTGAYSQRTYNKNSTDNGIIEQVSIINSRAIKDEAPENGDIVYIDFIDESFKQAIILTILKMNVNEDTNRTGGSLLKPLSTQAPPSWN